MVPPERGLSQSAARRQTNQRRNYSKRLPAFHPLRVGTTRAPLKNPSAVRRGIFVESQTKIIFSPVGAACSSIRRPDDVAPERSLICLRCRCYNDASPRSEEHTSELQSP